MSTIVEAHDGNLDQILARYEHSPSNLLQILREVQEHSGHIHSDAVSYLSTKLHIPRVRIEGVATFYSFLHLQPHGEYRVLFSDNITDRMLGSQALMEQMCQQLWLQPGKLSEDGLVSINTTSCTGMCDQGPAMLVNGRAITRLTHQRVQEIASLIRNRTPLADWPADFFRIEDNIRRSGPLLDNTIAPGDVLRTAIALGGANIVDAIKNSGLRGRGGAGFPTGMKWEACRNATGAAKHVVCNADEGEPGTFKDRVLLTRQADLVFEGMTLC
ncbi:MAG: NAD(P)H-dependent oxidoreductase subunit E, partial [Gallionella sp.]|nr:NAD(P)H-dependent oxidoreductase subunit E [Gallionella sp.]